MPKPTKSEPLFGKHIQMTCQLCGKSVNCSEGYIAHHGHKRIKGSNGLPGYFTQGCDGSRQLPREVSKDAMGRQAEHCREVEMSYDDKMIAHYDIFTDASGDQGEHMIAMYAYYANKAQSAAESWEEACDAWVPTITQQQWNSHRSTEVEPKRSSATREGWRSRPRSKPTDDNITGSEVKVESKRMHLHEYGIVTATFITGPTGNVLESIANDSIHAGEIIGSYADWATVEKMFGDALKPA